MRAAELDRDRPRASERTSGNAQQQHRGHPRDLIGAVEDAYLPLSALSAYSGLSVRTLRGRLHDPEGPLPHFRIGAKILVKKSDYDAWALRFRDARPATLDKVLDDVLKDLT